MSFWHKHGTKILGSLATVVSTAATVWPNPILTGIAALLGALTVNRGFVNTATMIKTYGPQ